MRSVAEVKMIDSQSALRSICASNFENFEFVCPLKEQLTLASLF